MKAHEDEHSVADMSKAFGVSRSHYYGHRNGPPGPRAKEDAELSKEIETVFEANKRRYGSPRITQALHKQGWSCGVNRIAKLMRENGIRASQPRRFVPVTTDSDHGRPVAPNRLAEVERVEHINQVWTADITYIRLVHGWAYLAVVMDLFSRHIVGWSLQEHLRAELAVEALRKALWQRRPRPGMLHHSDQGVQYASFSYQQILAHHHIIPSMSRRGNCYDNATMESFFGSLKSELEAPRGFPSHQQAKAALFEYIEMFYNRKRLHSSLGYRSPVEFEAAFS